MTVNPQNPKEPTSCKEMIAMMCCLSFFLVLLCIEFNPAELFGESDSDDSSHRDHGNIRGNNDNPDNSTTTGDLNDTTSDN
ncbi:MAG: hypothetical protein RLN62_04180 [Rickettsiales bacterium]